MTTRTCLKIRGIAMLSALCCAVILGIVQHVFYVYPTDQTKSAFLKSYSEANVIDQFKAPHGSWRHASLSSGAGRKSANHKREINDRFVMRSDNGFGFMLALHEDLLSNLTLHGAQVVAQSGDSTVGYRIDYASGKGIGKVFLKPLNILDPDSLSGAAKPHSGEVAVMVDIVIEENWFPHS